MKINQFFLLPHKLSYIFCCVVLFHKVLIDALIIRSFALRSRRARFVSSSFFIYCVRRL